MLSSRLKDLIKVTDKTATPLKHLWLGAAEKASETPVYGVISGIAAGCYAVSQSRHEKPTPEKIGAIGLITIVGMVGGFALAPVAIVSAPILAPVGLFAVYDHYKYKQTIKINS